jgi:hypothetical protein
VTIDERFMVVGKAILTARQEHLRVFARMKALEAMVANSIPPGALAKWEEDLDKLTVEIHQKLLESCETIDPTFGARMDDRSDDELKRL